MNEKRNEFRTRSSKGTPRPRGLRCAAAFAASGHRIATSLRLSTPIDTNIQTRLFLSLAALLLLSVSASARADELTDPRVKLTLHGGRSEFRGGSTAGSAIQFQPDTSSTTFAGAISIRALGKLRVEGGAAFSRSHTENGRETPENFFLYGGLAYPILTLHDRRIALFLQGGGGVVDRQTQDSFEQVFETAFDIGNRDPLVYGGAAVEWRLNNTFGLGADYRYSRIFPDKMTILGDRESYGAHRVTGGLVFSF